MAIDTSSATSEQELENAKRLRYKLVNEIEAVDKDQALQLWMGGNKPRRSIMGYIFKWSFILFNILMFWWWFSSTGDATQTIANSSNDAEQLGTAIGGAIGASIIFGVWFFGDFILGILVLFTRPKPWVK